MPPGDDIVRKKKKIDKYSASKISRKLRNKPSFQAIESSPQAVGSSSHAVAIVQGLHQKPETAWKKIFYHMKGWLVGKLTEID